MNVLDHFNVKFELLEKENKKMHKTKAGNKINRKGIKQKRYKKVNYFLNFIYS